MSFFKHICAGILSLSFMVSPVLSDSVSLSDGWKHQGFFPKRKNKFSQSANQVNIKSNSSVSLIYTQVAKNNWDAQTASWNWAVSSSVPATDLTIKGGDDRNIAVYFVFLDRQTAQGLKNPSIRSLLTNDNARVLVYVWGGRHANGSRLPSPYLGSRGQTIISRSTELGQFAEQVNIKSDFENAFGASDAVLFGLAISADSDDTKSEIVASFGNLVLN